VLVARCAGCHSGSGASAGLDLLSHAAVLKGGMRGPLLAPEDPEASLLLRAVRHEGPKMPPGEKLAASEVADLTAWVRMGAPWPNAERTRQSSAKPTEDLQNPSNHWAFKPVRRPALPSVKDPHWVKTPIDAFVLEKLEAKGLRPSPPADPRTLIRRLYFDLHGLPPSPDDVERFVGDRSPNAYAKLVDRLLASPRYGERWGRYWLDLARYADTKDYIYYGERRFPFAYTYRDYVIRALNEDKPYDEFLVEQIAGDCLPNPADRSGLAALGFLTLGRRFVNNQADVVDDRIDVVFRGTQGLTVTCARCHDHKFDPIPTRDYYSLYGVFAASTEETAPIGADPKPTPGRLAYASERLQRITKLQRVMNRRRAELSTRLRLSVGAYLALVPEARNLPGEESYRVMSAEDINPQIVRAWRGYIDRRHDSIFGPWHAFEALSPATFVRQAPAVAARVARGGGRTVHPRVAALFAGTPPTEMAEVAARYGKLLQNVAREESRAVRDRRLRDVLFAADSPTTIADMPLADTEWLFDEAVRKELNALQARVDGWDLTSPQASPHALVLKDLPDEPQPRVFNRGNRADKGAVVPRQLPEVIGGPGRKPFRHGSGRLELARAIASRDNPLTARVMVNRVWMGHFGRGIVNTPSDFGTRGDAPSHPELLDWLAATFVAGAEPGTRERVPGPAPGSPGLGWSLKKLHRLILLSNVYQQASEDRDSTPAADPENTLLWRMNRRRLDFEALRDTLLAVSGQLDLRQGGRPADLTAEPYSTRRTVYGLVDRQKLPDLFRAFDFPNPDRHNPQRYTTTSPQQSLFMMNSPFAQQCARALAVRSETTPPESAPDRIRGLYRLLYQREPTAHQLQLGLEYLGVKHARVTPDAWDRYAQALLLTNELVFAD